MSISITQRPEQNVVNIGDEITQSQLEAIQFATGASGANHFVTMMGLSGTLPNQPLNTNSTVEFDRVNVSSDSMSVVCLYDSADPNNQALQIIGVRSGPVGVSPFIQVKDLSTSTNLTIKGNGITFSDNTQQTTAFKTDTSYTFSQPQTITTTSASAALTVTQTGAGNSFVVNDQAGDPTPFVINSAGLVGINVTSPAAMLDIAHSLTSGTGIRLAVASGQSFSTAAGLLYVNIQNTGATGKGLVIENRGTGDCLYIHDTLATDTTPFVVDNDGNCIIGGQTITAGYKLDVVGNAKVSAIKIGSSDNLSAVNYTTSGQPATVDRAVYPNEIQVVINGITYAMPARAV